MLAWLHRTGNPPFGSHPAYMDAWSTTAALAVTSRRRPREANPSSGIGLGLVGVARWFVKRAPALAPALAPVLALGHVGDSLGGGDEAQ